MSNNKKYALITGASEGIGKELAIIAAQDGYNLVIVARSEGKLNEVANSISTLFNVNVITIVQDLAKHDAAFELFNKIDAMNININMLINNAGFGDKALFYKSDITKQYSMIQLNINTLTILTRLFIDNMIKNNDGYILNIASTASYMPGPNMSVYFASKAYVLSFTEALWFELKNKNIKVTALCPGATNTSFFKDANVRDAAKMQISKASPKLVAEFGYKALKKGKREAIYGFKNMLMAKLSTFFPQRFVMWVTSKATE